LAKQLADQQGGQFSANTQPNPKDKCKAITIRCGKQVGSDVNVKDAENNNQTTGDEGKVGEEVPLEAPSMENSKEDGKQDEENSDKSELEKDSEGDTIETCAISTCTFQTRS